MPQRPHPQVSSRKRPKQARADALISAVLEAAVQVLRTEGAARFTTARVAERAGVSVGSLYQYFPNKAAILFRLQTDEWQRTTALIEGILRDPAVDPLRRLHPLVHVFLRSECDEAQVRLALADAAPLYRDAPEADAARADGAATFRAFLDEALPRAAEPTRALAADLLETTLTRVGSAFSAIPRTETEILAYADMIAGMFHAWLFDLNRPPHDWT